MNINQGGIDRFPQYPGGQAQPGAGGYPGLGGGMPSIPGTGGFNLQAGLQSPLRPGSIAGMPGGGTQSSIGAQPRLGTATLQQLGLQQQQQQQQAGASRMGLPGQQQFGTGAVNGLGQGVSTGMGGPGLSSPGGFPSPLQQQAAQQGLGGRPGGAGVGGRGGLQSLGGGLSPTGMPSNLASFQQRSMAQGGGGLGGGGLAGLGSRMGGGNVGAGGGGGYGGGYGPPSGDLLSMLNKAGGPRQDDGPSFNASDFPSLGTPGGQGGPGGRSSSQDGANESFVNLLNSQKPGVLIGQTGPAFGEEDFPALPGASPGGGGGDAASAAYDALRMQQQRQQQQMQLQQQQAGGGGGLQSPGPKLGGGGSGVGGPDRYGLLGLLSVIRMTDADVTTLALGTDLTTLGLNLNSPEALWKTFASPWADGPSKADPEPKIPDCYLNPPPRLQPAYFARFQPDTLFYIFYGMPGDEAQLYAADELASRGWYYHKELKAWLTRAPNTEPLQKTDRFERGSFFLFDPNTWDVVRKENFTVSFDALERTPGVTAAVAAAAAGQQPPPPGPPK